MPAEAIIEAPPAAPVTAAAPKAPALPNAPKVEINASRIGEGAEPPPPPKPGSARERMTADLRKKAGVEEASEKKPEPVKEPSTTEKTPAESEEAPPASEAPKPGEDPKKAKVSPWKLVEEYKQKLAKAEAEKLEVEKRAIPEDKWKQTNETLAAREKRLNELEEEIRYVNYSKSEEFKNKYQVPYQKAWDRAMGELGELTVESEGGAVRGLEPNDILELVNLPLGKAHEAAVEKFGDLAPEVMAHRKEIRNLFDQQAQALEEARTKGVEREKQSAESRQRQFGEVSSHIKQTWTQSNEEIAADPKYGKFFTKVDGDENINQRLAKGFELADRAFSENPATPGLTAEQRASIVKRHAAVRNRAAAFGRLVYENGSLQSKISELEKALKEFKGSEPELKGSSPEKPPVTRTTTMEGVLGELRKRAKQS